MNWNERTIKKPNGFTWTWNGRHSTSSPPSQHMLCVCTCMPRFSFMWMYLYIWKPQRESGSSLWKCAMLGTDFIKCIYSAICLFVCECMPKCNFKIRELTTHPGTENLCEVQKSDVCWHTKSEQNHLLFQ